MSDPTRRNRHRDLPEDQERAARRLGILALAALPVTAFFLLASPYALLWPLVPVGVFGLLFAYRHLRLCVLLYCFLVPLETFLAGKLPGVSKALGALLVLVCMSRMLVRRDFVHVFRRPVCVPLVLWLSFVCFGVLFTIHRDQTLAGIKLLLPPLCIFFFILCCIDNRDRLLWAMRTYVLGAALCACLGMTMAEKTWEGRVIGFGEDPNFFATFFLAGYALNVTLALRSRRGPELALWLFCACAQVGMVLQSQSRAALAVMGLLTLVLCRPLLKLITTRTLALVILAAALGLGGVFLFAPENVVKRFSSMFTAQAGVQDLSTMRRMSYIPVALENLGRHPLTGSGLNTYPIVYAYSSYAYAWGSETVDVFRYAHNTFLEMYSDLGLPGGTAFLAIFLLELRRLFRCRRLLAAQGRAEDALLAEGLFFALAGLMLMLLTLSNSFSKPLWFLLGLVAGATRFLPEEPDEAPDAEQTSEIAGA